MKWETYQTRQIEEKYVWRYLTIEKLIDFLKSGSIFLARLDTFEDNLENINPYDIIRLPHLLLEKPIDANPEISENDWAKWIEKDRKTFIEIQQTLLHQQKQRFVSCWVLSDVESFGMWDLYGQSGFVVKFERTYFQRLIRESVKKQTGKAKELDLLVAGQVSYQNFDDMVLNQEKSKLKYSCFRKHLSFKHESEFRMVGFGVNLENEPGVSYKLPNIEELEFSIIANPRLSKFQFEQYSNIISKYSKKHNLQTSTLKIWLEFRKLIN